MRYLIIFQLISAIIISYLSRSRILLINASIDACSIAQNCILRCGESLPFHFISISTESIWNSTFTYEIE